MIVIRVAIRLGVMLFVLLIVEGFSHRDPWVDLGNGYNIGATHWGGVFHLTYFPSFDDREYSEWIAMIVDGPKDSKRFVVSNPDSPYESLEFATEEAWRDARRKKKASFVFMPEVIFGDEPIEGITEFKKNGRYAIAPYSDGFFLLDVDDDRLYRWSDRAEWEEAVRSIAGMTTEDMRDPKSWWEQYWDSVTWISLGIVAVVMLPWVVWPIVRLRFKRAAVTEDIPAPAQSSSNGG